MKKERWQFSNFKYLRTYVDDIIILLSFPIYAQSDLSFISFLVIIPVKLLNINAIAIGMLCKGGGVMF